MAEQEVRALYERLLRAWNDRSAEGMAALFREDGYTVGFDGTVHDGPERMREELGAIFASHPTAAFVGRVRRVVPIGSDVAVLHAVAGMVPPGGDDINPATNAVQTLVALRGVDGWRIAVFHNTPAAYHGRPEASDALTRELREVRASGALGGVSVPRPPFDLMLDGLPFGRVVSYDYDQPWAMGRFEPSDAEAHRRLVEGCELRAEVEDWPDLPAVDDDRRWAEALDRRGITDDDVDHLHSARWTLRWDGEEREIFAQEFDRRGFFTWRW